MKYLFIYALIFFITGKSIAQNNPYKYRYRRQIDLKTFSKDSINISFNDTYHLIEDSCAQITRYAHFNFKKGIFIGKFKDICNANPKLVVSEGNYNEDGHKDGEFVSHYLNGNLQATGSFNDNKYAGKWEFFYENGKPELIFEVVGNEYHILDAWDKENKQIVTNGKGKYSVNNSFFIWAGKIVNGRPDGTWELKNGPDRDPLMTEHFHENQFIDGSNSVIHYTDSSHIVLVQANKLPLCMAEQMLLSPYGCNPPLKIIGATYALGLDVYNEEIKTVVLDYLNKLNISNYYHNDFTIDGEIDEKGAFVNLNSHTAQDFDRKVILQLYKLPLLQPATINGKTVKQKFTITFSFENNYYSFKYKFLPLLVN